MGRKGRKSTKGIPEDWDEPKTEKLTLQMTPTGRRLIGEIAQKFNISISELVERIARGVIPLGAPKDDKQD